MLPFPPAPTGRQRGLVIAIHLAFCAFVLSVLGLPDREDAFPLSRYPMFAARRPPVEALPFAVAVLDDGSEERLGPGAWGDGHGVSTVRNQLAAVAGLPPPQRFGFCTAVAARVAADPRYSGHLKEVRIATGFFSRTRFIRDGDLTPVRRDPIARCQAR